MDRERRPHRGRAPHDSARSVTPRHLSTGAASEAQLAVSGQEVVAAWRGGHGDAEGQPGAGAVDVAIRGAGTDAFGPAQTVFAGNGRNLSLATDDQGRAALAFADAGANPDAAFLATSEVSVRQPGGAFGAPVVLGSGALYSAPAVTVASGRVFGAWMSQTDQQQPARIQATEVQQGATGAAIDLGPGSGLIALLKRLRDRLGGPELVSRVRALTRPRRLRSGARG